MGFLRECRVIFKTENLRVITFWNPNGMSMNETKNENWWESEFYLKEWCKSTYTSTLYCTVLCSLRFGQVRCSLAGPLWVRHFGPLWGSLSYGQTWTMQLRTPEPNVHPPPSPYHWARLASAGSAKPGGGEIKGLFATRNSLTWHIWLICSYELKIIGYT